MFDMNQMMGKVKEVQDKLKEAQAELVNITAEGESGGGMVKAVVNGKKQVTEISIDDEMVKPEDKEMMQDLIVAAVNKAIEEVDGKAREHMKSSTQGLVPNIPGFDIGNML